MTPASLSALPMPTSTIDSASSAFSFIESSWSFLSGDSSYVAFVPDPFPSSSSTSSDIVLRVEYPKGSYAGDSTGVGIAGVPGTHLAVFDAENGGGVKRALVSYEVAFSEGFDFVEGGKLPGLFGGEGSCAGGEHSDSCFSLRCMWRAGGLGEVYGYVASYDGFCDQTSDADGRGIEIECNDKYGYSLGRGSWTFEVGKWNRITEVAILNSAPSTANGVLAVYSGDSGDKAFELKNVVFTSTEGVEFTTLFFSTFFGGSSSTKYASKGGFAYFRNFQFYAGSDPSNEKGEEVKAEMPG
ncbi:hypothetical protein JCM10450v2_006557 [Rhodotorula kratochvilovae]